MLAPEETRIIKKYQNRKLYDTKDSCYVTLDEIAKLIRKGENVTVLDNRTKDDVTPLILTQILVDQEKSAKSILPLSMLKDIIQRGHGSLFDFIQRYVLLGVDSEQDRQREAERYIDRLVDRGEITRVEAKTLLKEVLEAPTDNQTNFGQFIGERFESSLQEMSKLGDIERSLTNLSKRLDSLEQKLSQLDSR